MPERSLNSIKIRTCCACKCKKAKKELLRIVRLKSHFELDWEQVQAGRGAYICPTKKCAKEVKKTGGLNRSFKQKVPEAFYNLLEDLFEE